MLSLTIKHPKTCPAVDSRTYIMEQLLHKIQHFVHHNQWFYLSLALLLLLTSCSGSSSGQPSSDSAESSQASLTDGTYELPVELSGGSGRASITSPCQVTVQNGTITARIEWSSSYYDYMIVDDVTYQPVNGEGNSVFEIPVTVFDEPIDVIADTTAMSTPHEIEYQLTFCLESSEEDISEEDTTSVSGSAEAMPHDTSISSELLYTESMDLSYAQCFSVDLYEDGYALITIASDAQYLLVPDGYGIPSDLSPEIVILQQPLDSIYLVASSVMDMFISMDALDQVSFTALQEESWYLPAAKEALTSGQMSYAGKYSAPDYEQILAGGCSLAIENTMIYHTPEVKEQLESFGVPVLVDYSSYESEPLGRSEWIKLYGLLTGHEEEARAAFEAEEEAFMTASEKEATDQTVVFFYITSNGQANVRSSSDYMAKMIGIAGGTYVFRNAGDSSGATVTMTMEEFYAAAKDSDYIIYNSTIDGELSSVSELTAKSSLLANFRAVQNGHVYCTTKNIYQSSMSLGTITADIRYMLDGQDDALTYLYPLN